jgi:hypothetical protein
MVETDFDRLTRMMAASMNASTNSMSGSTQLITASTASTKISDTSGQKGADLPPTQGMQQVPRCPNDSQQEHRNHNGDNDCEDWITA